MEADVHSMLANIAGLFSPCQHDRIYLVGGAVRDLLLGREHNDIDLVAALSEEEFAAGGFHLVVGKTTTPIWFRHDDIFGTVEVTPLTGVAELTADLQRRDFTINALAMTLSGELIDPLGGAADIDQRLLCACTPEIFLNDPLRVFRALRFETDGWQMIAETEDLINRQEWQHNLAQIPVERFSREMIKVFGSLKPEHFFERMLDLNVGEHFLPELFRMPAIPAGPLQHHPEGDLFTHSMQVLQRVSIMTCDPLARFCAFFHDIGKLATVPALYPKHHGHDQAGSGLALNLCQRLKLPTHHATALSWISRLHGTFNLWGQLRGATKLRIADQAIKAGIVDVLPLVAAADKAGGSEPEEWRAVVAVARLSARELGIDLHHLEGILPAKRPEYILQSRLKKLRFTQITST
jgi:tRNA nucleotidyltransferase (CCA-adding enzyme)